MGLHFIILMPFLILLAACQASTPHKSAQTGKPKPQAKSAASQPKVNNAMPIIDPSLTGPQKVPLEFAPGSLIYHNELGEQGVQGEAKLSAQITPEGFAQQVVLVQGSGNAQLDQNALAFVQKTKFRLEKRRSATELEPLDIEMRFHTQTLETFGQKTCKQFIKEVDYFKRTFPNKPADQVAGYHAMSGMAFLYAMQRTDKVVPSSSTFAQNVEFCQRNPDYLLFLHLLENNGLKAAPKKDAAGQ